MIVRILSAWPGSPPCGAVGEVPDPIAVDRIRGGWAEAVRLPAEAGPETAMRAPAEQAIKPRGKARGGRP